MPNPLGLASSVGKSEEFWIELSIKKKTNKKAFRVKASTRRWDCPAGNEIQV